MPITACDPIIEKYLNTLKSDFSIIEADAECRLVTPYYRPDGDAIEVVLKELGGERIRLSDDGQTLDYLFLSGLNVEKNKDLLDEAIQIARRCGASLENSEIFIEIGAGTEGESLAKLISAIESVTYLIYRRQHRELKLFADEVANYLLEHEVKIEKTVTLNGELNPHPVPIYINSTKNLVIEPLSATSPTAARRRAGYLYYDVNDIHKTPTGKNVKFVGVIDDRDEEHAEVWSDTAASAILRAIFVRIFTWEQGQTRREQLLSFARES